MQPAADAIHSQHASIEIDASPETVYAMVSDITRMGEWSPEAVGGRWVDGGTGQVGDWFVGENELPERTVLNYASVGIKAQIGDDEFTAWSVQNELDPEQSYYIKITGQPSKLIIGEHPAAEDAEAWTLALV